MHGGEELCVGDARVTERWIESRLRKCSRTVMLRF